MVKEMSLFFCLQLTSPTFCFIFLSPLLSDILTLFGSYKFSQLVPQPATFQLVPLTYPFTSLHSASTLAVLKLEATLSSQIILRIIITENFVCLLILSSAPRIIFISSGIRYNVHLSCVFSLNIFPMTSQGRQ